jgi:hypothetical protein
MTPLPPDLRKNLEKSVVSARDAAESACEAALDALGVDAGEAPPSLTSEDRQLRNALRAQQRQLGGAFEQLVTECAYEQWHVMLFARFLAENDLLVHPSGSRVTLDEVAELAREGGESDPWLLAAHYAAAMLPGIFRPTDPCVRLPLAPEGRRALEDILAALPAEVFTADDALGWVYQFWQSKKKKEVNASERKIGGADLAPVTQLFTEHYMVRFLLENSLGAWWAARHPQSPLLAEWEYLRYADDGEPAAGRFDGWPETVAEVTVMDPCCGSGHFLVAAFEMLRKMRKEEEGLSEKDAADAVLSDNLYGLELDARCIQLAAFALALAAWKVAGYHELPSLDLACSGIPTRGSLEEWTSLAKGDERLALALARLHELFRDADTLGSLIDPRRAVEDDTLMSVPFEDVVPLLEKALANHPDPVAAVFGEGAREVAMAASLLAGSYTLVATNVPFVGQLRQSEGLRQELARMFGLPKLDLAMAFLLRACTLAKTRRDVACVMPSEWLFLRPFRGAREHMLRTTRIRLAAHLGYDAFTATLRANTLLLVLAVEAPAEASQFLSIECSGVAGPTEKSVCLARANLGSIAQLAQFDNPESKVVLSSEGQGVMRGRTSFLGDYAEVLTGIGTGDRDRFYRCFWEPLGFGLDWQRLQMGFSSTVACSGRSGAILWEDESGMLAAWAASVRHLNHAAQNWRRGKPLWGKAGVVISRMGDLACALYSGERYVEDCCAVVPREPDHLAAFWAFCVSGDLSKTLRLTETSLKVSPGAILGVPFDVAHWQQVAEEQYPDGPELHSDDPTQWLFKGNVVGSELPLHVALARLMGYRWPDQEPDELDALADEDGIVCLPPVAGERPAHERLRELLVAVYGKSFSQRTLDELLASEGSTVIEDWLRDRAFVNHAKVFHNRPFIWHIWDGRRDGFAALVNCHKLDEQALQKLTYNYLGWWIDRQKPDAAAGVVGAEARLAAATELQKKLKLILDGEAPHDIYVRWKPLAKQPLGWQPDLNDGVRLNIRPFIEAGVLRAKLSINWNKDRGRNLDGSDRINDVHTTLAVKQAAREEVRASE